MQRESMVLALSGRLVRGLTLALTLLVSFVLVFAAQTEAVAQAQTSQVNVTTEGSGQTKITVNGQEVRDGQSIAQEDTTPDEGTSASAEDARADAGDLTCEQIAAIVQYTDERDQGDLAQYIDLSQNCDIRGGDVIAGTIPGKTLADTGGMPIIAMMAGLILAGGGLLLRASLRREP